LTYVGPG